MSAKITGESLQPVDPEMRPPAGPSDAQAASANGQAAQGFAALGLQPAILAALADVGYEQPSPIQAATIPILMEGRDLLGVAQTGTGKTAAFALPMLNRIDLQRRAPQGLVLAPTRELAIQVAEAFQSYAHHIPGFHVLPLYGGQDMRNQLRQLKRGVHIVVGTPGRIMDHLRRGSLDLNSLDCLVLDEADEMLRMGFIDDVEYILQHTPDERQLALFSATMPAPIRKVSERYLKNPQQVQVSAASSTGKNIEQYVWQVPDPQKLNALTRILEAEDFDAMIIFVRTKNATQELAEKIEARGFATSPLNGDMNQELRERTVERLKNRKLDIIVATDVAARGLDVERITHVINYDIPYDTEAYVHRIGRTGRAGRQGKAILFATHRERRLLKAIERTTKKPIQSLQLPSREQVSERRQQLFGEQIDSIIRENPLEFFREFVEGFCAENDHSLEDAAAALAYLAQQDRPLQLPPETKSNRDYGQPYDPNEQDRSRGRPGRDNREHRDHRERRRFEHNGPEPGMRTYRLAVGRDDQVTPKDIVGAIANESGIKGQRIGHIKLFAKYSLVDLPEDMSNSAIERLKSVRICNRATNIRAWETRPPKRAGGNGNKGKPFKKSY